MKSLTGYKIIISGLVSYKIDLEEYLPSIKKRITELGGEIVGQHIQRRGVSRSRKLGGSKDLNKPLSTETYISSGKVDELKEMVKQFDCDIVVFINDLTKSQINNLEKLTNTKVEIFQGQQE
ncbi:hypothetical protein [Flammeovirga sp. SJP92]|uniref:HflX-like GTP-binding protein n=1 Tax=Flammeovirga sp. SJP92 TaxID=1775430 RepID=UPI00078953E4|nr:hypothetical protein [Flammeovirga sp. SJP92]KXX66879.1 hypothetical protein AVL50_30585 [Flammeovirga sp. SJP92]